MFEAQQVEMPASPPSDVENLPWPALVERIARGDRDAEEELYSALLRFKFLLRRRMRGDAGDDAYHELQIVLVQAIRSGALKDPARLLGYARTVAQRLVYSHIASTIKGRANVSVDDVPFVPCRERSPEGSAIESEQQAIAKRVFDGLSARDREILTRFYVLEQRPEQIQAEMKITATQFRLIKSRAKGRYAEQMQKRLSLKLSPKRVIYGEVPSNALSCA